MEKRLPYLWVLLSHPCDLTYEIKLIIVCPCTNKKDLNMGYKVIIETEDGRKLTTNTPSHQSGMIALIRSCALTRKISFIKVYR